MNEENYSELWAGLLRSTMESKAHERRLSERRRDILAQLSECPAEDVKRAVLDNLGEGECEFSTPAHYLILDLDVIISLNMLPEELD